MKVIFSYILLSAHLILPVPLFFFVFTPLFLPTPQPWKCINWLHLCTTATEQTHVDTQCDTDISKRQTDFHSQPIRGKHRVWHWHFWKTDRLPLSTYLRRGKQRVWYWHFRKTDRPYLRRGKHPVWHWHFWKTDRLPLSTYLRRGKHPVWYWHFWKTDRPYLRRGKHPVWYWHFWKTDRLPLSTYLRRGKHPVWHWHFWKTDRPYLRRGKHPVWHWHFWKTDSSLPKETSTLRPLGVAMGTPSAWPVSWSMNTNTQCTWHWQVDACDAS